MPSVASVRSEKPNCLAISLTPSPLRANTRISTACSSVNIDGRQKTVILSQVGHFYFGAVGQYYFGVNNKVRHLHSTGTAFGRRRCH